MRVQPLEPPLVQGVQASGARQRLRGPPKELPAELSSALTAVPTTVHDEPTIRFGDSLLLLNHSTEVLLQADTSGLRRVTDDTAAVPRDFDALRLTTGRVLYPCARNSFHVVRASRASDGFPEDDLEVHFGQEIWLIASSFLRDQMHVLHVVEPPDAQGATSTPVMLPRATKRSAWRLWPASGAAGQGRTQDQQRAPPRRAVRVNEEVMLQNVASGRFLTSTVDSVATGFGVECQTLVESWPPTDARGSSGSGSCPLRVVWSFVNDAWCDAVAALESSRASERWKDDSRDDFSGQAERLAKAQIYEADPAFQVLSHEKRNEREDLVRSLTVFSGDHVRVTFERVAAHIRSRGMHGARQLRRACEAADIDQAGTIPASSFQGVLATLGVRVLTRDVEAFVTAFADKAILRLPREASEPPPAAYGRFLEAMEGIPTEPRCEAVRRAYQKLYVLTKGRTVTVDDIMDHWSPTCYREVREGTMERREAYEDFLRQWDLSTHDGYVSPAVFMGYYRDVSACFQDTDEFVDMVQAAWDL